MAVAMFLLILLKPFVAEILSDRALSGVKTSDFSRITSKTTLVDSGTFQYFIFNDKYGELIVKIFNIKPKTLGTGVFTYKDKSHISPKNEDLVDYLQTMVAKSGRDIKKCTTFPLSYIDFTEKAKDIEDKYIEDTMEYYDMIVSSLDKTIMDNSAKLAEILGERDMYSRETDLWKNTCYSNFSKEQCSEGENEIEQFKNEYQTSITLFNKTISEQRFERASAYGEKANFVKMIDDKSASDLKVTAMRGLSIENTIYLKLNPELSFSEYLSIYTHELHHCLSWDGGESSLPSYFEEGATDYYASKTFGELVSNNFVKSYPLESSIYADIVNKVGEDKAVSVYQSKDEARLCDLLTSMSSKTCKEINDMGSIVHFSYNKDNQWDKYIELRKFLEL